MNFELFGTSVKSGSEGIELRIYPDKFWSWTNRLRRSSEVALMESPNFVRGEGPDDGVQNASVVEEHEVLL